MTEPRLLQVFLSRHGVFEVSITMSTKALSCTCPGFDKRRACKHTRWVGDRMPDGEYPVRVSKAGLQDVLAARDGSADDWRRFIYAHCTPEVI